MLQLEYITKRFGLALALDDVSLTIQPNQIHGLLGENGAGKSTLMNILFGLIPPTAGAITINKQPARITSPRAAQALGIGMVHQHFKLVPTLTVLENLALALHTSPRKISPAAHAAMQQLHWQIPLHAAIASLSVGQQQRVEIIKALLAIRRNAGVPPASPTTQHSTLSTQLSLLILDEPTAVLTPQEAAELFTALTTLKSPAHGNTAIIFISHKLAEVQKICDTLTILRRGKHIHTGPAAELSAKQMTEKMVGAAIELPRLRRDKRQGDKVTRRQGENADCPLTLSPSHLVTLSPGHPVTPPPILQLTNLFSGLLQSASLQILPGEILGIAGVDGNGQSDLVQAIVGGQPITAGALHIAGQLANRRSIRWRADRLAYIPEDRHRQALILPMTLPQNLLLKKYRTPPFSKFGWLRFHQWQAHAKSLMQQFDIRANSPNDAAAQLSGGNQQKIVLARELCDPSKKLVIAVNPTRGLDIGATAFVMNQLLAARQNGAAVLLVHSDLDELLAISDKVAVLYNGELAPTNFPEAGKEAIGQLMLGLASPA